MGVKLLIEKALILWFSLTEKVFFGRAIIKPNRHYQKSCKFSFRKSWLVSASVYILDINTKKVESDGSFNLRKCVVFGFEAKENQRLKCLLTYRNKLLRISVEYEFFINNRQSQSMPLTNIAHAMGDVEGVIYTNSKEAFESNYAKGIRFFEIDLQLTSDNYLFLFHDTNDFEGTYWLKSNDAQYTRKQLVNFKYKGKYNVLSFVDFLEVVRKYEDTFFLLDIKYKESNEMYISKFVNIYKNIGGFHKSSFITLLERIFSNKISFGYPSYMNLVIEKIKDECESSSELLNRFIPQVNKRNIENIYGSYDFPYKIWRDSSHSISEDLSQMFIHGINNYSLRFDRLDFNPEATELFDRCNLFLYGFTDSLPDSLTKKHGTFVD